MDNMKIILALDNYSIYAYNSYYLCVPNNSSTFYHLFIGFSALDLTSVDEELLYKEIRKIADSLNFTYKNAIYVLPIIDPVFLNEAAFENDDRMYNKLLKKYIQPITSEVHNNFMLKKMYISQKIKFIKQNDIDKKIIGWLSMKLGNDYVREIIFDDSLRNIPIEDNNIPLTDNNVTIDYEANDVWLKQQEDNISDTLKPAYSFGFSRLGFLIMMVSISLFLGIAITYMIIK